MQVGVRDWKGWRELIDAFAIVARSRTNVRLALVACRDEAERAKVTSNAIDAGVADRVVAVEYRTDMPSVLASADCVVDASWSGTGITGTIREAMALGKPVVATDCGGNRELVSSSQYGWIVPPRDRGALAASIEEDVARPDRAAEAGHAARERVVGSFSKTLRIDRLEEIYRGIVRQKLSA